MNSSQIKPALTPDFVTRTLHLKVAALHRPKVPFSQITTDSRQVKPGSLFVAIKGEKFDGHDYIENAIASGARGILCQRGTPLRSIKDLCIFTVEDTLNSYRRLAAGWRKEFSIPIVIVAGSVGKTTTKELLAAILKGKWSEVHKTQGSQNGFVGIPMTLLELRPEHQAAVIEVGIDECGAMQQHVNIIGATASILTAIGPEHLEKLHDVPTIAREEGIALTYVARSGGTIAINLDDPWIRPHLNTLREGRKIPFSLMSHNASANMNSGDIISGQLSPDGSELTFQGFGMSPMTLPLPLLGNHNAANLLGAISVAIGLGLTADEIRNGLQHFQGAEGRSQIKDLPGPIQVICDYYNAQPASVEAGLELLAQTSKRGDPCTRKWACLGDMLEMGLEEERIHRDLANKIMELGIEYILLYGPRMAALAHELQRRGYPAGQTYHFNSQSELASFLCKGIKPGDTVLIKGSRGMKMEEVWKILEPFTKTHWSPACENSSPSTHP